MTPRTGRPVKDLDKGPVGKPWSFRLTGKEAKELEIAWKDWHLFCGGTKQQFLQELISTALSIYVTKFPSNHED